MEDFTQGRRIVAIYSRVSTDKQAAEGHSLQNQTEILEKYAQMKWPRNAVEHFQDVQSGRTSSRPSYNQLLREIKAGKVLVVCCIEISRIWRSLKEGVQFMELLDNRGSAILIPGMGVDTTTAVGRCFTQILLSFAELESKQISDRVKRQIMCNEERGLKGPGLRPFGWKIGENRILESDEREQGFIDYCIEERAKGVAWASLARDATRLKINGSQGAVFSGNSLRSSIENAVKRRARKSIKMQEENSRSSAASPPG